MEPNQPLNQPRSRVPRLFASLIVLVLALLVVYYRQSIIDHFLYWSYQPSSTISQLATSDSMTSSGRYYFYASHPQVDERSAFNTDCHNTPNEQTIVLGCYVSYRIYIFDVTDSRLDGIKQVTAAHEMLHAAYQRLSDSERSKVDAMITEQLKTVTDPNIQKLIDVYAKTEPGEKLNELHSILGTELASMNPDLEQYYKQYFSDRQAVVKMASNYQAVFDTLQSQQAELLKELNTMADTINAEEAAYTSDAARLNTDIESFNSRANSGDMSASEFNNQRADLANRQMNLRQQYDKITADIAAFNQKKQDLDSINTEADTLNHSIDSTLSPVPNL